MFYFRLGLSSADHDWGLALFGLEFGHVFVSFNFWLMRMKDILPHSLYT